MNKVVDADRTNFTNLVAEVVDKYPHDYGDIVRLFYFCMDKQQDNAMFGDLFCEIKLGGGVVF